MSDTVPFARAGDAVRQRARMARGPERRKGTRHISGTKTGTETCTKPWRAIVLGSVLATVAHPLQALTLTVDTSGALLGAEGVEVDGSLYDVVFRDGSFTDVFGATPVFDAVTEQQAIAFSEALLDQVFIDGPQGAFDQDPALTIGCAVYFVNTCNVYTPYAENSATTVLARGAGNEVEPARADRIIQRVQFDKTDDLSIGNGNQGSTYADWTLATPVPLPATSWPLAVATGALVGGAARRPGRR